MKEIKKEAIKLHAKIIRSTGFCEKCLREGMGFTCAHIIKRRRSTVVTDTRNAFCLCIYCHSHFENHPREFSRFITTTWAQPYYDEVYRKSVTPSKVDWQQRVQFLLRIHNGEISLQEARELESRL